MPVSDAPSQQELYEEGRIQLLAIRPELQVLPGDISDMLLSAASAMADRVVGYTAMRVKETFVDGAEGDKLITLAQDHWEIAAKPASRAGGVVNFSRLAATAGAVTIPAGTIVATAKDALGVDSQFETTAEASFAALALGPIEVPVQAILAGTGGNVAAGKITRVVSTLFDSSITVVNPTLTAGGSPRESDESLRNRIRGFATALQKGVLAALEYGAYKVPGVAIASAVEDPATGLTTVYIADADGNSNESLAHAVLVEFENWRAAGALVNVTGGQLYNLNPIQIRLTVRTGVDTAAIATTVKQAIVARIARLRIGEPCRRELISQAALNIDPDNIIGCTVILPAADVAPSANSLIRTTVGAITVE